MGLSNTIENDNIEQNINTISDIIKDDMSYNKKAEHEARPRERKDFGMTTISLIGSIGGTFSVVQYFFAMPMAVSMVLLPLVLFWLGFSMNKTLRSVLRI